MNTLKAEKRDMSVKAKKLRREGFVTGNVFGKTIEGSIPVRMVKTDAEMLLRKKNRGSQIILEVDGEKMNVLIKEIDYNGLKKQINEIDFQVLVSGEVVHSVAEIVLLNHDKVTAGVIQQWIHEIRYKAVPAALVEKVEIDVGALKVGDSVKVKDLAIAADKDVELEIDPEETILMLTEVHNKAEEADTSSETGEEKTNE